MKKYLLFILLALGITVGLTACKSKVEEPTEESETVQESTEDPFSLGGIPVPIDNSGQTQPSPSSKEIETQETYEDGSYTALLENGDTIITMNGTDLKEYSKLTEGEAVTLDAVIGAWKTDDTLPVEYLSREINSKSFPSLTDSERTDLINGIIKTEPVHNPDNTKKLETQTQETVLETKDYSNLSSDELDKLLKERGLGS